jgi:hypothetical protein
MGDIPDDAAVTMLSIPGTHDSCCVDGPLGLGKTQNLDLPGQLRAGIRFLDIRFAHHQDNLCVHHNVVCTEQSYTDVLTICDDFLTQYPSEIIVMSVKEEDRFDSALGTLAPPKCCVNSPHATGQPAGTTPDRLKTPSRRKHGSTPGKPRCSTTSPPPAVIPWLLVLRSLPAQGWGKPGGK